MSAAKEQRIEQVAKAIEEMAARMQNLSKDLLHTAQQVRHTQHVDYACDAISDFTSAVMNLGLSSLVSKAIRAAETLE